MKTANLAFRPAALIGLIAGLTLSVGLPVGTSAQEGERTIATGSHIPLSSDAPDQYVVKPHDTLWDIAKVFLRDPWYWPEIWYVNPQVANPHLIYPGDVLKLVHVEGKPRVTLADDGTQTVEGGGGTRLSPRVRNEPLSRAITAIPYDVIASFMGRPTLLDKDQASKAPYVVAMRDDHVIGALGNEIYVRGVKDAAEDSRHSIIHIQERIYDPDTRDLLGYSGMYVGSGPISAAGDPAKLLLTDSSREALQGDKVFPESVQVNVDFVPHAPAQDVQARVIGVSDHTVMGQYQVVALNRGTKHGLEPGHVLALYQAGHTVRDRYSKGGLGSSNNPLAMIGSKVQLPDERAGIVMVFKSFERMSYALIMETTHEIGWGDYAKNP